MENRVDNILSYILTSVLHWCHCHLGLEYGVPKVQLVLEPDSLSGAPLFPRNVVNVAEHPGKG